MTEVSGHYVIRSRFQSALDDPIVVGIQGDPEPFLRNYENHCRSDLPNGPKDIARNQAKAWPQKNTLVFIEQGLRNVAPKMPRKSQVKKKSLRPLRFQVRGHNNIRVQDSFNHSGGANGGKAWFPC